MIRLIIYDLDGTLIDSAADIATGVNGALSEVGFRALPSEEVIQLIGGGVRNLIGRALEMSSHASPGDRLVDQTIKCFQKHYGGNLLKQTRLYPPVIAILERFKDRKQAVISNKPDAFSKEVLEGLGIASYFIRIIGEDGNFPKKPSPESVFDVMRSAGASAAETVFVGDSEIDVKTGKNAGTKTIALTNGYGNLEAIRRAEPDYLFDDFSKLSDCPLLV